MNLKIKVPPEFRTAAKGLPEMQRTADRLTAVMDAANVTAETIAVAAVFGVVIYALIKYRK